MTPAGPRPAPVGWRRAGSLVALRGRHAVRLGRDVVAMAVLNGVWWLIPLVAIVVLVIAAIGATQQALPYAVYTLF